MSAIGSLFDLKDRVAIVTGASSGLGHHFALTLAEAGVKVALAARRLEPLNDLARRIEAIDGRAIPIALDVTDPESVAACVKAAETELGAISILVNNAGIADQERLPEQSEADWSAVIDTNLTGAWRVAQEVAGHMIRMEHGGAIINVASVLAFGGAKGLAAYCAAKAGLVNLTRVMALELARHDVRVNALCPGYIETDMNRETLTGERGKTLLKTLPQRRFGAPEDLDGALLLLASSASRYMTGATLVVDGGLSARLT